MDFFQRASICARDIQFERHTRKKGLVPGQKYDTIPPYMGLIRSIQEFWLSTSVNNLQAHYRWYVTDCF